VTVELDLERDSGKVDRVRFEEVPARLAAMGYVPTAEAFRIMLAAAEKYPLAPLFRFDAAGLSCKRVGVTSGESNGSEVITKQAPDRRPGSKRRRRIGTRRRGD
jgi:hypothetical protein